MKKLLFIILVALTASSTVSAQISYGGFPPSFNYPNKLRSTRQVEKIETGNINIHNLIKEDVEEGKNGTPLRIATIIPVDVDMKRTGEWTSFSESVTVWQQTISAPGAIGMILGYKDFYIPQGGQLFIYNKDCSQILGAYTNETNPGGGRFSNEIVYGDELTLEYVQSQQSDEEPRLVVEDIGYVYNKTSLFRDAKSEPSLSLGAADDCMVNVNCEEGNDWQKQKRGVVRIAMKFTKQSRWSSCSGSLINNTNNDGAPFLLTANHCFYNENSSGVVDTADYKQAHFYFNFEHPGCENLNVIPETTKSLIGADLLVHTLLKGDSDGLLLKLKEDVPEIWNPYYNGWDLSTSATGSGVVIHHPDGDVKKISTYTKTPASTTWSGGGVTGMYYAHWRVYYAETQNGKGVTEGGSSGSPLFNSNGLIIGTLSGGSSYCESVSPGGSFLSDLYGRMSYHWNKSANSNNWMKPHLDPAGKNVTSLQGFEPGGSSIDIPDYVEGIKVSPNPVKNEFVVEAYENLNFIRIYDMNGRMVYEVRDIKSLEHNVSSYAWGGGTYTVIVGTDSNLFKVKIVKY